MRAGQLSLLRPSLQARGGIGRPATRRRGALDAAGPRPARARRWHGGGSRDGGLGGGRGRAHAARRAEGNGGGHRGSCPLRSRGAAGTRARALVLVPLPRGRRGLARGAHTHRAPAGHPARAPPLRLRVLPALGVRPLRGLSPHAGGQSRPRRAPGRLHLRDLGEVTARAPPRSPRGHGPRRATAAATRSTRPTPICRRRMPPIRGS